MEPTQTHRVQVYEWAVGILGLISGLSCISGLHHHPILLTLLLIGLGVVVEIIPVPLGKVVGSLIITLPIGVMVVYGRAEAICMMIAAGLLYPLITRAMALSVAVFNAGQYALCTYALSIVYSWFGRPTGFTVIDWYTVVGVILGATIFILCNHFLIHFHNYLRGRFDVADVATVMYADGVNAVVSLPFAFLMIALGPTHPYVAPVVMLPVILLGQVLRLFRRMSVMQQVHSSTMRLTTEFDEERICEDLAVVAQKLTFADAVLVLSLNADGDVLVPTAVYPFDQVPHFQTTGFRERDGGVIWNVVRQNGWEYVPDTRRDSRVVIETADGSDLMRPTFLSMAIFPMQFRGAVHGAIVCYSYRAFAFSETTDYVVALAKQGSVLLENAELYRTLQEQSRMDGATGLFNYRFFYEALSQHVQLAQNNGEPLSVVVADVDYFKKFNDTWGHLAGDAVLRSVGQLMSHLAGTDAIVARYGGEEFGLIVRKNARETYELMESIRTHVSHHVVDFDGYRLQGITLSIGIAGFPEDSANDRDLLLKADSAMYWGAKQRGRNRVALYSPEFDAQLFVDGLTGLYTYHFINIRVREEFSRGVDDWGIICLDLENFSYVNNTFGFETGDMVLRETSQCIKECLRQTELACRYGGDEFLVLLSNVSQAEIEVIAQRIQRAVASHRYECVDNVILPVRIHSLLSTFTDLDDAADLFERVGTAFANMHQEAGQSLA